jgi:hypothetical protein
VSGHYTHVHVEVPKEKANDFFAGKMEDQKPKPPSAPTPQKKPNQNQNQRPPIPSVKPKREQATINGFVYKMEGGKYYENGKEIDKKLYESVKKNHRSQFKLLTSSADTSNNIIVALSPQQINQMQPQMDVAKSFPTFVLNNNKLEEVAKYRQFLNA